MDIRQLKYFTVVAEERNISRAAARLHISQPPLTRHIQSLEEELDVKLFTRTNWGVELTQAGEALLVHARNIRAHVELASEQVRLTGKGLAGRIDIGIYGSAMLNHIPRILNLYSESHPGVRVVLYSAPRSRQLEALRQGRIMVAFDRYLPESPEWTVELVSKEPILVALNSRNPLAELPCIHAADLHKEPMIGEQDPTVLTASPSLFRHLGYEPTIVQKANDMISATIMVAGGFGSTLVPQSVRNLQLPNVVYRPLVTDEAPLIDLHCAYMNESKASPLLAELLHTVSQYREQSLQSLSEYAASMVDHVPL